MASSRASGFPESRSGLWGYIKEFHQRRQLQQVYRKTTNNRLARATRILPIVLNSTSYKESLKNAGLKILEHRRIEQALILVYKSIHRQEPNYIRETFILQSNEYSAYVHLKLVLQDQSYPTCLLSQLPSRQTLERSTGRHYDLWQFKWTPGKFRTDFIINLVWVRLNSL